MVGPADPENEHVALAWRTWRLNNVFFEAEHSGKYALIHDAQVLGFFVDALEAFREGLKQFPVGTFLVQGVKTAPFPEPGVPPYRWPERTAPDPPPATAAERDREALSSVEPAAPPQSSPEPAPGA